MPCWRWKLNVRECGVQGGQRCLCGGQDGVGEYFTEKKQAFELSLETCRVCRGEEGFLKINY